MNQRMARLMAWVQRRAGEAARGVGPWLGRVLAPLLTAALSVAVAIVLLFEEWGWEPLHRAVTALGRWRPIAMLEITIGKLPPYGALAAFALPVLLLIPVKLGALWLLAQGQHVLAIALLIAAKLVGTGIVARIYHLTRPQLMRIGWVVIVHDRFMVWKDGMFALVRASWAWRWGRIVKWHVQRRIGHAWALLKPRA